LIRTKRGGREKRASPQCPRQPVPIQERPLTKEGNGDLNTFLNRKFNRRDGERNETIFALKSAIADDKGEKREAVNGFWQQKRRGKGTGSVAVLFLRAKGKEEKGVMHCGIAKKEEPYGFCRAAWRIWKVRTGKGGEIVSFSFTRNTATKKGKCWSLRSGAQL